MRSFFDDFRYGVRLMMKAPGVALTAILALALGIGANTAIFSVVYNVLLKPLPVREPARLFQFTHFNEQRNIGSSRTPYPDVVEWRRQLRSVEEIAAANQLSMTLSSDREPERVFAGKVTENFFPMLGAGTVLGRNFLREEDQPGQGRAAILSHELWTRRFGANPNVVGSQIILDGDPYTVVGVLSPRFRWVGQKMDVFVPLAASDARGPKMTAVTPYGRMRPGTPPRQLQAELDVVTAATAAREPRYKGWRLKTAEISDWIVPDVRVSLWVLLGAVGLVLLIACANVANLLLARAAARRKEIAVRAALGAGRRRLIAQLVAESSPVGLAGGVLGLMLAWWCIQAIPWLDAGRIPRFGETTIDFTILAFTAAISLLTCALFGFIPAIALSRADVIGSLKEGGRGGSSSVRGRRLRDALVMAEVAIALVLAIGATLMIRTFTTLSNVDPGFSPDGVLAGSVELPRAKIKSAEQLFAFYDGALGRIRSMPGVLVAGLTNSLPLGGNYFRGDWQVEGRENKSGPMILNERTADPGYFKALQIPLTRGRYFDERDRKGATPVALINETAARKMFPGEDPVGRRIGSPGQWATIVGVAADIKHEDVATDTRAEIIAPFHQAPSVALTFVVRLDPGLYPDPMRFAPLLRRAISEVDKEQAVYQVASLENTMARRLAPRKLSMVILIAFATLSLVLAAMGIYGVLSFSVQQRTHEIGVRMALGAREADVLRVVVREGLILAASGLGVGLAGALALTRLATSILYGVTATDPAVFAGMAVLLTAVAAVASYVPARRAMRVDPVVALRYE